MHEYLRYKKSYFSQKQLLCKMMSRLVITKCAGYILWQFFFAATIFTYQFSNNILTNDDDRDMLFLWAITKIMISCYHHDSKLEKLSINTTIYVKHIFFQPDM